MLLALLYLGVKNIHLGPTLPAFLSPNVAKVLVDTFGIAGIGTVESDLALFFGDSEASPEFLFSHCKKGQGTSCPVLFCMIFEYQLSIFSIDTATGAGSSRSNSPT